MLVKPEHLSPEERTRLLERRFETLSVEELQKTAALLEDWAEPMRTMAMLELVRRKERISEGIMGVKRLRQSLTRTGGEPASYRAPAVREETENEQLVRETRETLKRANTAMWLALLGCILQAIGLLARFATP